MTKYADKFYKSADMKPPRSQLASSAGVPGTPTVANSVREGTICALSELSAHWTRCKMCSVQCSSGPSGAGLYWRRMVTQRLSDVQRPKFVVGLRHFQRHLSPRCFLSFK